MECRVIRNLVLGCWYFSFAKFVYIVDDDDGNYDDGDDDGSGDDADAGPIINLVPRVCLFAGYVVHNPRTGILWERDCTHLHDWMMGY